MDAIALLCTLHADGPATARRLRHSGCSSLGALLALEPEHLATILDAPPAVARRFLREAKSLNDRLGGGWNDREEEENASVVAPVGCAAEPAQLQGREQRIVDEVLASWRRKDAEEAPAARGGAASEPSPGSSAGSAAASSAPAAVATVRLHDRLFPGIVDGLDADACTRLTAIGIAALDDLAQLDAVAVARATALGFTRVSRWRALAERARRTRGAVESPHDAGTTLISERTQQAEPPPLVRPRPSARVLKFSPSEAPPGPTLEVDLLQACASAPDARSDGEGIAGPFA